MYDIHCHILPGLDDGAPDVSETLRMAAMAAENGTEQIVCTPHCSADDPYLPARLREILARTDAMNEALRDAGIPVELYPGMELLCTGSLRRLLMEGEFLTLARSRYILLEFPFDSRYSVINAFAQDAADAGLRPVLAHPERYDCVQRDPERLSDWLSRGWLIQLNRGSITGSLGLNAQRTAHWLLLRRMAHFCASDAHRSSFRTPDLSPGYAWIARHCSAEYATLLLETNPRRLINDRFIPNPSM